MCSARRRCRGLGNRLASGYPGSAAEERHYGRSWERLELLGFNYVWKNIGWNEELKVAARGTNEDLKPATPPPRMGTGKKVRGVAASGRNGGRSDVCAPALTTSLGLLHLELRCVSVR